MVGVIPDGALRADPGPKHRALWGYVLWVPALAPKALRPG
jgi:hypothetical protein